MNHRTGNEAVHSHDSIKTSWPYIAIGYDLLDEAHPIDIL